MPSSIQTKLRSLASTHEVLTTGQLLEVGISDQSITRLVEQGQLTRVRRGILAQSRITMSSDTSEKEIEAALEQFRGEKDALSSN